MTAEELTQAALARALEFTDQVPAARSVCYPRLSIRQRQLVAAAAEWNPSYYGRQATLALVAGAADLTALPEPAERIERVTIADPGTAPYAAGREVTIVPVTDAAHHLAPRALLRDYTLQGVDQDLAHVASVTVYYARRAPVLALPDDVPILPEPFHELLVLDLAIALARKLFALDPATRTGMIELWQAEEAELLADYEQHVRTFAAAEASRFGRQARPLASA